MHARQHVKTVSCRLLQAFPLRPRVDHKRPLTDATGSEETLTHIVQPREVRRVILDKELHID